jgi:pyridoxamine 5'-phosphate oxidase
MVDRSGKFEGNNPFEISKRWISEAEVGELNDPNAIALSTVSADGMPNVRMVLLKNIDHDAFVFFTNFNSKKATEILGCGKASFVWHSKFLRRQIRVRGFTSLESDQASDEYYNSRSLRSRLGAWASLQSTPLASREVLLDRVEKFSERFGEKPTRPEFWGGFRIVPAEIEFWAEGESRLHDRFLWVKGDKASNWNVERLYP